MTDQRSPLDAYTGDFGAQLCSSAARLQRTRRRRLRISAIVVPLAAAASLAVAFWPGEQANVLERASAALSPSTGVVHMRLTSELVGARKPTCQPSTADIWLETGSKAEFPRWRYRADTTICNPTKGLTSQLGHVNTGTEDHWYDGHDLGQWAVDDGWAERLTDVTGPNRQIPDSTGTMADLNGKPSDPIRWLRGMLASGKVHASGTGTVNGRSVRFLRGPIDEGDPEHPITGSLRIAVDAQSYVPVEVLRIVHLTAKQKAKIAPYAGYGYRVVFEQYDMATQADLSPTLPAGVSVSTMDYRKAGRIVRRNKHYPTLPVSKAERARADARLAEKAKASPTTP